MDTQSEITQIIITNGKYIVYKSPKVEILKKKSPKVKGVDATADNYQFDDFRKLSNHMKEKTTGNHWLHYLCLNFEATLGIRNSDIIGLKWSDIYDPKTGNFKKYLKLQEEKTGKNQTLVIVDYLKKCINEFLEGTGVNPAKNRYKDPIFLQYTGRNKGEVMTYNGFYREIKRSAEKLGIDYNVATHSARKFFGATQLEIHSDDPAAKSTIQDHFNHSSEAITNRYVGITKAKKEEYQNDLSDYLEKYMSGEELPDEVKPLIRADYMDLKELIVEAFNAGAESNEKSQTEVLESIMTLTEKLNSIARG